MTKIQFCENAKGANAPCQNKYQDQRYGPGNRVMNMALKPPSWRCTVCGKEHAR